MKKVFKWIGILLLSVIIVLLITAFVFKSKFENADKKVVTVDVTSIAIPTDSASIERGRVLSVTCRTCHNADYSGADFFNDPAFGFMASPNLTKAPGSAVENYTDDDWVRSLRHGVTPEGRRLMIMPSEAFGLMSDQDLGSLIAFLKTVPPVEKPLGPTNFTFMAKVLGGAGMLGNLFPYDIIDHEAVHNIAHIPISDQPEYGKYMVDIHGCNICHGKTLNGALTPDPVSPPASNITVNGNFGNWSSDQFISVMRTGKTPEGKTLDNKFMPWAGVGAHDSIELVGLYNYLRSVPGMDDNPEILNK